MSQTILIAAGGTGGHIYPALAVAKALRSADASLIIEFVGTPEGLENEIIPREGFKLNRIRIGRLNRNVALKERIKTLCLLPWAMLQALILVLRRRPRLVLGVGGYASGPVVLAAALLRRPSFVWEPNAHPGMANRILAPFVDECLVVFPEAARLMKAKKVKQVGMPVREQIEKLKPARHPADSPLRILIFGGSQGAQSLNTVVSGALIRGGEWLDGVELVHQTGAADFQRISALYSGVTFPVEVKEYLHDMGRRYQWADLVICRSGTGTLSELAACGKAAVLVPLASAADNHQQRNAEVLVAGGAAVMILQKEFTPERFRQIVEDFKEHREKIDLLGTKIQQFHSPDSARAIGRHLLEASQR